MKVKSYLLIALTIVLVQGCNSSKKITSDTTSKITEEQFLEPIEVKPEAEKVYRAANTRVFDLLHTNLEVSFNWEKQYVNGLAKLTLTPYFYDQNTLTLHAKGFNINKVSLLNGKELTYSYDSLKLTINLDKTYTKTDSLTVVIDYVAKPNEAPIGGSAAITEDKGLYFINPLGTDKNKPKQIWTQGETEANSKWFPTIDSPNEKMTHDIYITVKSEYKTLSNGTLVYGTDNGDGTRTDYWKQDIEHAPYLVMLAVGEFALIEDSWKKKNGEEIDVNYYVEAKYENEAMNIFGNTPEMLTFFSDKLGVEYPWAKYSQIVVRDFVSGAMENTTAVIHGEFLQQTKREMLDRDFEFIVAHELFHHWFGDYLTCESWANLPLNESFATYGEYLWEQYKYGQDAADYALQNNIREYLTESANKQENLIRYYHNEPEDMFDAHSYQKGGAVLHMLRKYVGDNAFFEALKLYLTKNALNTVEIADLRQAFEQVTGEDLNWFFNQWFLSSGHPILNITYEYDSIAKMQHVIVEQKHSDLKAEEEVIFKLPFKVGFYTAKGLSLKDFTVENKIDTLSIAFNEEPLAINFDYEKVLLGQKRETKEAKKWHYEYYKSKRFLNKSSAFYRSMLAIEKDSAAATEIILDAMNQPFWAMRTLGITFAEAAKDLESKKVKDKLISLSMSDPKAKVRMDAIATLNQLYGEEIAIDFYETLLEDPSYGVLSEVLYVINDLDSARGVKIAEQLETQDNSRLKLEIARVYAQKSLPSKNDFMVNLINTSSQYGKISAIMNYQKFLVKDKVIDQHFNSGLELIKNEVLNEDVKQVKTYALSALKLMKSDLENRENPSELITQKTELIKATMKELKEKITDEDLLPYLNESPEQ